MKQKNPNTTNIQTGEPKADRYKKHLLLSAGGHVVLTLVLLVLHKTDWGGFQKKTAFVPSLKVTMTALPEKAVPKVKQQAKKPAPFSLKKPPVEKSKQVKKDKPKKPKQKDREPENKDNIAAEKTPAGGNLPSAGQSEGDQAEQQIIINEYLIEIIDRIKRNWNLPKYLTDHSFRAELEIKINAEGQVTEIKIITSSYNEIFDGKVLEAIELSAPFPPPPESARALTEDGIIFQLNSREE